MKTVLATVLWISIGLGVFVGNAERYQKPMPEKAGVILFLVIGWPAIVTVEIYRAILPERKT